VIYLSLLLTQPARGRSAVVSVSVAGIQFQSSFFELRALCQTTAGQRAFNVGAAGVWYNLCASTSVQLTGVSRGHEEPTPFLIIDWLLSLVRYIKGRVTSKFAIFFGIFFCLKA